VVGEDSPGNGGSFQKLRLVLPVIASSMQTTYLTSPVLSEVCDSVSKLGPDSIVLFISRSHDEHGHPLISAEVIPKVAAASGAPVYTLYDTHVGTGALGGYVASFAEVGKAAGREGIRVLAGEDPPDLVAQNVYMFDARQLQRWKIPESALPPGSVVLFREPNFWDRHRNLILGGLALLVSQSLLIFYLLWQRTNKRKVEQSLVVRETQLQKSLGTLQESEDRFRLMADTAPVLMWMAGTEKLCTFFNHAWLDFTGRSMEQELGEGWARGVHPDDLDRCLRIYSSAFDARMDFEMEYRLRRHDGKYRWIVDIGVPRFESTGEFLGYIGSCIDITDRKATETSLEELTGRLIAGQEAERTRIARDLHDDFSQRLALLGIGLGRLWKKRPESEEEERVLVRELWDRTKEMSTDVHRLSHQLHSSKLEHVGLGPALNGLCEEIGEKYEIQIYFTDDGVSSEIPKDVALCLFRIAQEALSNEVKYSQARQAQVDLRGASNLAQLRIMDAGVGFDPAIQQADAGIGLVSMRERLRIVGGVLSVRSAPNTGTEIFAQVPLSASAKEAQNRSQVAGA